MAVRPNTIGQAEFHSIGKATLGEGSPNTNGITTVSMIYSGVEKTNIGFWDYYAYDIANSVYFDYGRSESIGNVGGVGENLMAIDDALEHELDLTLIWKPVQVKGLIMRTWFANRTSEYNGSNGKELKQNQWRVIAAYNF